MLESPNVQHGERGTGAAAILRPDEQQQEVGLSVPPGSNRRSQPRGLDGTVVPDPEAVPFRDPEDPRRLRAAADPLLVPNLSQPSGERRATKREKLRLPASVAEPPIRVTIGRIDVRAVMPERAPERAPAPAWQPPILSLDEYLSDEKRR
jgi:hypothetical protein